MPRTLVDGELMDADDPRAVARRQQQAGASQVQGSGAPQNGALSQDSDQSRPHDVESQVTRPDPSPATLDPPSPPQEASPALQDACNDGQRLPPQNLPESSSSYGSMHSNNSTDVGTVGYDQAPANAATEDQLPSGAMLPPGAVMGVPIREPPTACPAPVDEAYGFPQMNHMGGPRFFQGSGYQRISQQQYDEFEDDVQAKISAICCASCFPCCIGDPMTDEWREKVYAAWCCTFCGWSSLVMVAVFTGCCIYGAVRGDDGVDNYLNLSPGLLHMVGSKDTYSIVFHKQVWRLFSCIFLHASLIHTMWNLFVQMSLGWMLETGVGIVEGMEMVVRRPWGWQRTALLYWCSGVTGALLGCVAAPEVDSVGASAALMGLVGARIAGLMITWTRMPVSMRYVEGFQYLFWCIFIFCFGLGNQTVDNWGHLGGLVAGLLAGGAVFTEDENAGLDPDEVTCCQRAIPKFCVGALLALNATCITYLCTVTVDAKDPTALEY